MSSAFASMGKAANTAKNSQVIRRMKNPFSTNDLDYFCSKYLLLMSAVSFGRTSEGFFSPNQHLSKAGPTSPYQTSFQFFTKGPKWAYLGISSKILLCAGPGLFRKAFELATLMSAGWTRPVSAKAASVSSPESSFATIQAFSLSLQPLQMQ